MTILRKYLLGLSAVLSVAVLAASSAQAQQIQGGQWNRGAPTQLPSVQAPMVQMQFGQLSAKHYAQRSISASEAKSIAARAVRGAKFVDISRSGGRYRVRMIRKDGRVVDVLIDAATGRVLN